MSDSTNPDYDFRHHLYTTMILLGGDREIARLLKKSLDGAVTGKDVEMLKNYNVALIEGLKMRLVNINTMTIRPGGKEE